MDLIETSIKEIDSEISSLELTLNQKQNRRASLIEALASTKLLAVATPEEKQSLQDRTDALVQPNEPPK